MNQQDVPIGRVIATENTPTTTGNVRFWLEAEAQLKPFDIVRLIPPNSQDGDFYVIITEIHQVSDEVSPLTGFVSADFGQSNIEPRMSRIVTTYADATVLYNTNQNEMPVPHGSRVHWPEADGVRRALGIDGVFQKDPRWFHHHVRPQQAELVATYRYGCRLPDRPRGRALEYFGYIRARDQDIVWNVLTHCNTAKTTGVG